MWKYVSRRVKDTIELSINVRKSFTVQQSLNNQTPQQQNEKQKQQLNHFLAVRQQDPSRDKDKSDEKFKRKYHRLHNNQKCFLSALTWVRNANCFGLENSEI